MPHNQHAQTAMDGRILFIGPDAVEWSRSLHGVLHHAFEAQAGACTEDGLSLARAALSEGRPYSVAFVGGCGESVQGLRPLLEELCKIDPGLEIVVCCEHSQSPHNMLLELGLAQRSLVVRTPFEASDAVQLARMLCTKRSSLASAKVTEITLAQMQEQLNAAALEQSESEARFKIDALTSLPSRHLLTDRLDRCMKRGKRDPQFRFAVLLADIDGFHRIVEKHGVAGGQTVLAEVGKRLGSCLRTLDSAARCTSGLPSRFDGDEFVVLLDGLRAYEDAEIVAERIQRTMALPILVAGQEVRVSVCQGYAFGKQEHQSPEDPIHDASVALFQAKDAGPGQTRSFDQSLRLKAMTNRRLADDLRVAVQKGQLRLMFQPIVSLESGQLESFEALVRWEHPELGPLNPSTFVPLAVANGSIHDIGLWVLREGCRQIQIWRKRFQKLPELSISVNVSCKQLGEPNFLSNVERIIQSAGIPSGALNIEITESVFIENIEAVCKELSTIRTMGVGLYLDDFGTGYSSLSSFHHLPIDAVKIDRSFVSEMGTDGRIANIVQAIQTMATNRNIRVIVEGIETFDQLAQLQTLGCNSGQGYFLSRPIDARAAEVLINRCELAGPSEPLWTKIEAA